MEYFRFYSEKSISSFISARAGEIKLGEKMKFASEFSELEKISAQFVIFGIPEDIGVRANFGKAGTSEAFPAFLKAFLNIPSNRYMNPEKILLFGEVKTSEEMTKAADIDISDPNYHEKLGDLVVKLDTKVSQVVQTIISAGKIPIIIGGGHNNAYGNLKGTSLGIGKPVNVLNIDAHTDLRKTDYRHSGNGFSYAFKNGFLNRYSIFGLHENYTPQYIFDQIIKNRNIQINLFEEVEKNDLLKSFAQAVEFVKEDLFGLEVDCDSISGFPSSAISPSGFTLNEVRQMVQKTSKESNCAYLHLCEAAVTDHFATGKALAYLASDFIKGRQDG